MLVVAAQLLRALVAQAPTDNVHQLMLAERTVGAFFAWPEPYATCARELLDALRAEASRRRDSATHTSRQDGSPAT